MKLPLWVIAIVKSAAGGVIVVTSLAVSLAVLISPPPETVAVFVTVGIGASAATFTVRVIGGYAFIAPGRSARLQVSVARVHVQPVPLMAVAVNPGGSE